MPIDNSIYFQQKGPDFVGSYQDGMKLSDMAKQRKKAADEEAWNEGLKNSYEVGADGKATLNQGKLSELGKSNPLKYAELQKKQESDSRLAQEEKLKTYSAKVTLGAQMLGGINDANSYNAMRPKLLEHGIFDAHELPEQYDPKYIGAKQMQAMSVKDRLDLQMKQQESALGRDKTRAEIAKLGAEQKKILAEAGGSGKGGGFAALSKDYAKDYNDWTSSGKATVDKNLERLYSARAALKSDNTLTGGFRGMLPDNLRNITNEKAITTRDDVRAAASSALKATLGPAFTEKEGERIMNQAYNEKLSPEANIEKLDAAIKEIETAKANQDAKAQYFEQNGTLAGFKGGGEMRASNPPQNQQPQQKQNVAPAPQPHPQDNDALAWAQANFNDPRAQKILQLNGASIRAGR